MQGERSSCDFGNSVKLSPTTGKKKQTKRKKRLESWQVDARIRFVNVGKKIVDRREKVPVDLAA